MRLKSIKLAGFKSFVDPTTVNFPSNMCSVVGPNGCGKSNIIDAVRWVLGESSAKNLRGEAMTDVIFNGTTHRQPVGQASIELIFDNTSGKLVGEYASYAEISVRRVVGREGTSEYWLNGAKCRRRDITDLFLGTGLGPRSYAIIEQGMISRLIESKPEELRIFIEEAAGISKYKERRRETESRMRRTLENLERLADLREELERNLQHLLRQSQAAEKYAEFRAEERELKSQLLGLQWREHQKNSQDSQQALTNLDIKQEAERAEFERVGADIEGTRVALAEATDAFNTVQADYYSVGGEVTRVEQALKYEQERRATIESDLLQTRDGLQESKGHLNADTERLAIWRSELESLRPDLSEQRAAAEAAAGVSAAAEEAMSHWQSRWDEFNQKAAGPKQVSEVQQSRIVYLEQVLQRIHERGGKLRKELEALASEDVDKDLPELEAQIRAGEDAVKAQEEALLQLDAEVAAQRENIERSRDEQDQVRARLQQLKGQEASLQALQDAALAEGDVSATQQWLADLGLDNSGSVYEALQVQDQWTMAVESVLAARLTGVCTQSFSQVQAAFDTAPAGASILSAGEVGSGIPGTLAEKVRGPASVLAVLAGVHIADDLGRARSLLASLPETASVITPQGDWLGYGWASKPSKSDAGQGIILRKASLDSVTTEMREHETSLQTINATLETLKESRRSHEDQRRAGEATLKTHVQEQATKVTERGARVAAAAQARQRIEQLQADLADSGSQFEAEQASLAAARSELQSAIEQMALDGDQRAALSEEREQLNSQLQGARESAREARDSAHRTDVRVQSLDGQVATVAGSIDRLEQQVEQLQSRVRDLTEQLPVGDNPDAELQSELETLLAQRVDAEAALTGARQRVSDNDHALREQEKLKLAAEHRLQAIYTELESGRLQQAERNVRIENLE
ncbi:MAG: chromosome segregation protein SMC [Halioglobus sp.]|nr:chromosome segregation protein SMC [Halioglobus sp.]